MPEYCPYCGETGGQPRFIVSREYQGQSPHGGMVEWEDECCSLCMGRSAPDLPGEARQPESQFEECPF